MFKDFQNMFMLLVILLLANVDIVAAGVILDIGAIIGICIAAVVLIVAVIVCCCVWDVIIACFRDICGCCGMGGGMRGGVATF